MSFRTHRRGIIFELENTLNQGAAADRIDAVFTSLDIQGSSGTPQINMNDNAIINLLDPTNPTDAANKRYVDERVQGLDTKDSVRVATTADLASATYNNTAAPSGAGQITGAPTTIDGVTLVQGDRVLVKDGVAGSNVGNGIYEVSATTSTWNRAQDADNVSTNFPSEVTAGMYTFVSEGTTNEHTGWVLNTDDPITLGTTALTFTQFSAAGVVNIVGGDGIDVAVSGTTNTISVDVAGGSVITNTGGSGAQVDIVGGTAGQVLLSNGTSSASFGAVDLSGVGVTGTLPVGSGGTGQATLDDIVSGDSSVTITNGTGVVIGGGTNVDISVDSSSVTGSASVVDAGSSRITVTNGADRIVNGATDLTLDVNEANLDLANIGGSLDLTSQVTGILPVPNGGTGVSSVTANSILIGDGTNALQEAATVPTGGADEYVLVYDDNTDTYSYVLTSSIGTTDTFVAVSDGSSTYNAVGGDTLTFNDPGEGISVTVDASTGVVLIDQDWDNFTGTVTLPGNASVNQLAVYDGSNFYSTFSITDVVVEGLNDTFTYPGTGNGFLVTDGTGSYNTIQIVGSTNAGLEGINVDDTASSDVEVGIDINGLTAAGLDMSATDEFIVFDGVNNVKMTGQEIADGVTTLLSLDQTRINDTADTTFVDTDQVVGQITATAVNDMVITTGTAFDVDASGAVTIDGVGASNLTTDAGNLTLSTTTSGNVNVTSAGNVTVSAASGTATLSGDDVAITSTGASDITMTMASGQTVVVDDGVSTQNYINNMVSSSLAPKEYVDQLSAGLDPKASVEAATLAADGDLPGWALSTGTNTRGNTVAGFTIPNANATFFPTASGPMELDGVVLSNGDRVLVKDESNPERNGIYEVNAAGTQGSTDAVLVRAGDFDDDPGTEVNGGEYFFVTGGNTYENTGWTQTETVSTMNTDPVEFVQFSSAGVITVSGGDGVDVVQTGTNYTVSADVAGGSVITNTGGSGDQLDVVGGTTGQVLLSNGTSSASFGAVDLSGVGVTGTLPVGSGGTGQTTLDDIVSGDSSVTITNGTGVVIGGGTNVDISVDSASVTGSASVVDAGSSRITVTNGADRIVNGATDLTLDVNEANLDLANIGGSLDLTSQVTGVLPVPNGGTGVSSVTANTLLIGNGTGALQEAATVPTGGADEYILVYDDNTDTYSYELRSSVGGNSFGVINGDTGTANAAATSDTINIVGATDGGITTVGADGSPDSLTIALAVDSLADNGVTVADTFEVAVYNGTATTRETFADLIAGLDLTTESYTTINGDTGSVTAAHDDALTIAGGVGLATTASATPDTVTVDLDFSGSLTPVTDLEDTDLIAIYDDSAAGHATVSFATLKSEIETEVDVFQIADEDELTRVRVGTSATDSTLDKVEMFTDVSGTSTKVVEVLATGGPSGDAVMQLTNGNNGTNDEVLIQAGNDTNGYGDANTTDDIDIHLVPANNGEVIVGSSGAGKIQADDNQSITLAGGDGAATPSPANTGGDVFLVPGAGSTANGDVVITTSDGADFVIFEGDEEASAPELTVAQGTDRLEMNLEGANANVDFFLNPKGDGLVLVDNDSDVYNTALDNFTPTSGAGGTDALVTKTYVDNAISGNATSFTLNRITTSSTLSTDETVALGRRVQIVDTGSSTVTVTLPTGLSATDNGLYYSVKRIGGNLVTIDTGGSELIDGNATHDITVNYESVTLVYEHDATTPFWHII